MAETGNHPYNIEGDAPVWKDVNTINSIVKTSCEGAARNTRPFPMITDSPLTADVSIANGLVLRW